MMEVTALCSRLLLIVLLWMAAHVHHSYAQKDNAVSDAGFLHIVPTRLQFLEYESISFHCEGSEGSAEWRGARNAEEFIPACSNNTETSTVTCTIVNAFVTDSEEYWCETGGGERSNTINITITAGDVILESPVLPVMEGDAVTLRCSKRETPLNYTTVDFTSFYKDGVHIWTNYSEKMTIESVSKSDEGLYKCLISGAGESPESRLTVINNGFTENEEVILEAPVLPVTEGDAVTLRCRKKTSSSDLPAVFYKDGLFIGSSSTGNLSIHFVYKSHEGLYRCNISGGGTTSGSWLAVRAPHRETWICSDQLVFILLLLRTVSTVVMVPLLLLLVGLMHCGKLTVAHK